MKNPISMIVAILLVAVIALTACSQQPAGDSSPSESQQSLLEDSIFDSAPATDSSTVGSTPTDGDSATEGSAATEASIATEASTAPDENTTTGGNDTTETTTQPTQATTNPTEPGQVMDYETFQAMTPAQQQAFQKTFPSLADFFDWYNAAKKAYEQSNPPIEVGGNGQVDMGQLGGGNG